jgi:quercetin dioxygenase-like cupin family protein
MPAACTDVALPQRHVLGSGSDDPSEDRMTDAVTPALTDQEIGGSSISLVEWIAPPGPDGQREFVAPFHRHLEDDEAWYVLAGRMGFYLDGEEIEVGPGGAAMARAGVVHTYWNAGSETARYVLVMSTRIRALIAALHDETLRAGRTTAEVFRDHSSELVDPDA